MYYTKEQPTTGSFVKVWFYKGIAFSRDYMYIEGVLCTYDVETDDWIKAPTTERLKPEITDVVYITPEAPKYMEMII